MSSFLWLLLYLAPLLVLAAAVFGWLGWRWRGTDLQKRLHELEARLSEMQTEHSAGELAHEELRGKTSAAEAAHASAREELSAAQAGMLRSRGEALKAQELSQSLKSELARMTHDMEVLRGERDQTTDELATAQAEIKRLRTPEKADPAPATDVPETPPAERPKRVRTTAPRSKTTAPRPGPALLQDTLAALTGRISTHQAAMTTVTGERDKWQRSVTQLESQSMADPAELGLAQRSLADSEKRLQAAGQERDRLQNQAEVLRRVQEGAAALADVPDDDLTRIKGIKNVINEQLRAHGIRTWQQIAQWNDDELRAFSELLAFKNRATREKWKEQARDLHEAAKGQLL